MDLYNTLHQAKLFYERQGYKYIEAPWLVSKETSGITKPEGKRDFPVLDKVLVGSAEQSFLELVSTGALPKGKYVTITPCFRDEEVLDELHQTYFMKAELFNNIKCDSDELELMINDANLFFKSFGLKTRIIKTDVGAYDIVEDSTGIELGSYGGASHPKLGAWLYGTACAEPRLSQVIEKVRAVGYHLTKISKSRYGTIGKIYEETLELLDAEKQDSKIMQLVELSDLYGAIEAYAETHGFNMEELKKMSDITKRAFKSGRRT